MSRRRARAVHAEAVDMKGAPRTASSLPGQPLRDRLRKQQLELKRASERLAHAHDRSFRQLFSKRDLRRIGVLVEQAKTDWRRASLKTGGDALRIGALRHAAAIRVRRAVAREFPQSKRWRLIQKAYAVDQAELRARSLAAGASAVGSLDWGVESVPADQFRAPFTVHDVQTVGFDRDDSRAFPERGELINSVASSGNSMTYAMDAIFGVDPQGTSVQQASCGVAYRTARAGRLQISATLQNIANRVTFSLYDNFGFSSAELRIALNLFVGVATTRGLTLFPTTLYTTGYISHGNEASMSVSALDDTRPYTVHATTEERFEANREVFVLAGSEISFFSRVNDMGYRMDALTWWMLKSLAIKIVD